MARNFTLNVFKSLKIKCCNFCKQAEHLNQELFVFLIASGYQAI